MNQLPRNKKLIFGVLLITLIIVISAVFIWTKVVQNPPKETPTTTETTSKKDKKFGYLYLLFASSDIKNNSYNVKVYDSNTQEIIQISQVTVPFNAEFFDYANGEIFYILGGSAFNYSTEILSLDLKNGQKESIVKVSGDESQPPKRKIESYFVHGTTIFFLDCVDQQGVVSGSSNCKLNKTYFEGDKKGEVITLTDLSDVFKETYSNKTIRVYDPYNNILAFQETTLSDIIGVAGVSYFYELEFNTNKIAEFDQSHEEEALLRDKFVESREPEKKRCLTSTPESGIFEKERSEEVFPPQIRIGCFDLEELKSIAKD